jgi:hypothetical protein
MKSMSELQCPLLIKNFPFFLKLRCKRIAAKRGITMRDLIVGTLAGAFDNEYTAEGWDMVRKAALKYEKGKSARLARKKG